MSEQTLQPDSPPPLRGGVDGPPTRSSVPADVAGGAGETSVSPPRSTGRPPWRRVGVVAAIVGVLVIVALVALLIWPSDEDDEVTTGTTGPVATEPETTVTTEAPTTTESPTTTVTPSPGVDVASALYPAAAGTVRFDDPVAVADSFARDWIGFTDPIVGPFMQGDARSGEVEIRPIADGPVTTVFVRQLGPGNSWWVLGTATGNITTDQPAPGATISSPVTVAGSALAFEGNVLVEVRQDGSTEPLGSGFVTGGGDVMRPFEGQVEFSAPSQPYGAMVFLTRSEMDGSVWEATIFRVRFS